MSKTKYNFWKIYLYDTKPDKLTNQIKQITKYSERKKNLEDKINDLKNSNLPNSKNEIEKLMKKDTLGEIDFDSIVIADFDESLKSVTTSFLYSDVSPNKIKFIALNQWFDETLFKENSTNQIYFPSINKKKYNKFRETYFINFNKYPSKISIISYDILGLVYYLAKKNKYKINKNFFVEKNKFIGEIGSFEIKNKILDYKLKLYQVSNNQFIKVD